MVKNVQEVIGISGLKEVNMNVMFSIKNILL